MNSIPELHVDIKGTQQASNAKASLAANAGACLHFKTT